MTRTTTSLVPSSSSAPVVSCAFHPSRKQLFLLAFGDGVLAAFDYAKLPITRTHKKENTGFGVIRCHARGIHAFRHLHDPSIAGSAGITGAGFVPGQRSRAVTAGEDGRCFLVDFEKGDTIGSWHIGAPATGLTIREITEGPSSRKEELGEYLIAVGTVNGKCLVYDGNGNKIAERVIDADAECVLDVEWVSATCLSSGAMVEKSQVFGDVSLPEGDMLSLPDPASAPSSPRKTSAAERSARANRSRIRSDKPVNALTVQDPNPAAPLPEVVEHAGGSAIADPEPTPTRRRNRAFSPPIYDSLDETADQGYMNLFSPVKRKRAFTSASLPVKKTENANKSSDPRIRATQQGSDHRSAISAPLLWEEKIPEGGPGNKEQDDPPAAPAAGGFGAFQTDTQRETTSAEETHPHSQNGSVFGGMSNAPGERIKVEERIDDGRILSEIKSIRAMYSGKSKSSSDNVPLLAPYLPEKARSTPASRVGAAPNVDPSIRRAVSVPEGKVHTSSNALPFNDTQSTAKSDNQSVAATARNTFEETEGKERQEAQPVHEEEQEEIPTEEDDEDIWLAQTTRSRSSRSSRKRKKVLEEETIVDSPFPQVGIDLSRSVSTTRSSKSRKTVSWSDEAPPLGDTVPTPMGSSSLMAEWGDGDGSASAQSYLGSTRPLSSASHHRTSNTRAFSATTSSGTAPEEKKATSQDGVQTIDEIVKTALADMQAAMLRQMNVMQVEMQRQFREQNHELQGLRNEMGRVREENQKLRSMLFRSSGVRDSVRRTGDPSTPR